MTHQYVQKNLFATLKILSQLKQIKLQMNIDGLLKRYLGEKGALPVIEMFDSESIHAVYKDIVNTLKM